MTAAEQLAALPLGRIENEDIDVYHASPCLSVSKMKVFRHSPALYHGRFITKKIPLPKETKAFADGKAIESLGLDGRAAYESLYYVVPEGVGKVKVGDKAIRENLAAQHPGKVALSFDDAEMVERININLHAHHLAGPLLAACKMQVTFRIKGELFHLQVRPDGWSEEGCELTQGEPFIADLKSLPELPDDEPEVIPRQISDYWYQGQATTYRDIVSNVMKFPDEFRPRFFFIFVGKKEPYAVQVVELDDAALDLGFKQVKDTLDRLRICHLENRWPISWNETYLKEPQRVGLPSYYLKKENAESGLWG